MLGKCSHGWVGAYLPSFAKGGNPSLVFVCCLLAISVGIWIGRAVLNNDELRFNEYIYPWWVFMVVIKIALYLYLVCEFFIIASKLIAIGKKKIYCLQAESQKLW